MTSALTAAMRARDRVAVSASGPRCRPSPTPRPCRSRRCLRAGAIEAAAVGAGAADAPRRELTPDDVRTVVEAEVTEHDRSAAHLADAGRPDDAARVAAGADVLRALLAPRPSWAAGAAGSSPAGWSPAAGAAAAAVAAVRLRAGAVEGRCPRAAAEERSTSPRRRAAAGAVARRGRRRRGSR